MPIKGYSTIGKHPVYSHKVTCHFRLYLKIRRTSFKLRYSTEFSGATTVVYKQKYPTLPMVGIGQMSRLSMLAVYNYDPLVTTIQQKVIGIVS